MTTRQEVAHAVGGVERNWHRSLLFRALTLVGSFVALCLALEVTVRCFFDSGMEFNLEMWKYARQLKQRSADPLIGHEHRPNARAHLMGVDVAINAAGHRDREIPLERKPGVGRVIMLGDSFVEGWGVPFEETVSKRLERLFDRTGHRVEVMNTGVGNYGSVMEVRAFLTRDARFNPDVVVLNYTFNDAEPVPRYDSVNLVVRNSEALAFLAGGVDNLLRFVQLEQPWDRYYLQLYEQPGWDRAQEAVHELVDYSRRTGIGIAIVSWPELHDVQHYRLQSITDRVRAVSEKEKVPFLDLLEAVRREDSATLAVTPQDPHPNARANQLYGDMLFGFLQREFAVLSP